METVSIKNPRKNMLDTLDKDEKFCGRRNFVEGSENLSQKQAFQSCTVRD